MRWIAISGGGVALIFMALGLSAFANWQGWTVRARDQAEHAARLESHFRISMPDPEIWGEGPFPTVLQFHGCGSALTSQDDWAEFFAANGYAAIIVDSLAPRDISRPLAAASVCTGIQLTSVERAGDIIAAIHLAEDMPQVDGDNLFLAGWSHGGWSIMDLLSLDLEEEVPPNLTHATADDLSSVRGAILIYPYCGFPSRSEANGWQTHIPVTVFMGGIDPVAPAQQCMRAFERLQQDGADIQTTLFEDADHDFDVRPGEFLHRDRFHESATAITHAEALRFLETQRLN